MSIDEIMIPWNKFPAMKVWRVVRKMPTPGGRFKFEYVHAESKYRAYPHRSDAYLEAQRLTDETGEEHVTIRAWLIPCEAEAKSEQSA